MAGNKKKETIKSLSEKVESLTEQSKDYVEMKEKVDVLEQKLHALESKENHEGAEFILKLTCRKCSKCKKPLF